MPWYESTPPSGTVASSETGPAIAVNIEIRPILRLPLTTLLIYTSMVETPMATTCCVWGKGKPGLDLPSPTGRGDYDYDYE
jgi:hypothetical protein